VSRVSRASRVNRAKLDQWDQLGPQVNRVPLVSAGLQVHEVKRAHKEKKVKLE
jgi:hypothetical protein